MPFPRAATRVIVFIVPEEGDDRSHLRLIRMLRCHNIGMFGGFARAVLEAAPLPVLMAH
jgi:hypothetical protein